MFFSVLEVDSMGATDLGTECLRTFMISKLTLGCSHW